MLARKFAPGTPSSDSPVDELGQIVDQHGPLFEALRAGDSELSMHKAVEHDEEEGAQLETCLRASETALA